MEEILMAARIIDGVEAFVGSASAAGVRRQFQAHNGLLPACLISINLIPATLFSFTCDFQYFRVGCSNKKPLRSGRQPEKLHDSSS
jgi:hypothetical protein